MEEMKNKAKIAFRTLWGNINKDNQHLATEKIECLIGYMIDLAVSKERERVTEAVEELEVVDNSKHR
jgi:hypothetical protein